MTAPLEVPLARPAEVDGAVISSILVRSPAREDLAAIGRLNARAEVKGMRLISRLTGLDWRVLALIGAENEGLFERIDAWIAERMTPNG